MNFFENFNVDRFLFSLQYMWKGMLCIFVVIAVIILSILIIGKLSSKAPKEKDENNN